MPAYDYRCQACGKEFEEFSRIDARHEVRCACGGATEIIFSQMQKAVVVRDEFYTNLDRRSKGKARGMRLPGNRKVQRDMIQARIDRMNADNAAKGIKRVFELEY